RDKLVTGVQTCALPISSFRRERETGLLELLLVSPLGERAIIFGRLGGLWSQFLPSFCLLMGIGIYFSRIFPSPGGEGFLFFASTFVTLPMIGLYFSLRCRNFISGFLCTIALGVVIPVFAFPVMLSYPVIRP